MKIGRVSRIMTRRRAGKACLGRLSCAVLLLCLIAAPGLAESGLPYQVAETSEAEVRQLINSLMKAIEADDQAGVIKVLSTGFPADFADNDGNTLLMHAAKLGKPNALAALLAGDAKINAMAKNGVTALMLASNAGHVDAVKLLLANQADPNLHGSSVPAAMHLAVINNHVEVLKLFVKLEADLEIKDPKGLSPLELAFLSKRKPALDYLRQVHKTDMTSMFVTPESLLAAISEKDSARVLKALALGIDPNAGITEDQILPLESALNNSYLEGVGYLLFAGADPNRIMPGPGVPVWWLGLTDDPQHKADVRIVQMLLKGGAKLDLTSAKGVTALTYASSQANPELAKLLRAAGAK